MKDRGKRRTESAETRDDSLKLRLVLVLIAAVILASLWLSGPLWAAKSDSLEMWAVTVLESDGSSARLCGEWGKITVQFQGKVPELVAGETYRLYLYRHALCEVEILSIRTVGAGASCFSVEWCCQELERIFRSHRDSGRVEYHGNGIGQYSWVNMAKKFAAVLDRLQ